VTVFIGEGGLGDGFYPGLDRMALGHVDRAKNAHFKIRGGIVHRVCLSFGPRAFR
jgi:hypothetical protein